MRKFGPTQDALCLLKKKINKYSGMQIKEEEREFKKINKGGDTSKIV